MAEGGVEESATVFPDVTTAMCDACQDEDSFQLAAWYCQQCRQHMCDRCRKYHMRFATTKSHTLTPADAVSVTNPEPREVEEGIPDEYRVPTCHLHGLPVEFYCHKHNAPVCNTCKLMNHRKCPLQDLENAATGTTDNNMEVLQEMRELESEIVKIEEVTGSEKESIEAQKTGAIEKIKKEMKAIEVLGQKNVTEVENIAREEHARMDKESHALLQSKVLIQKSIKELERIKIIGSDLEIFVATKKAEEDLAKFRGILHDSSKVSHAEIVFELDSRLKDMTSIGYVGVEKSTVSYKSSLNVTEILSMEAYEDDVKWFHILPGEKLILLYDVLTSDDCWGPNLNLYSANGALLHELSAKDDPVKRDAESAVMLNDYQVIVPMITQKQLHIVNINGFKTDHVIKTNKQPHLILKYTHSSVLALVEHDNEWYFQIIELTGKVQFHVKVSTRLKEPTAMRMGIDRSTVYIVDRKKGCFGFSLKGKMLFNKTNSDFDVYYGLATDIRGALYFAAGRQEDYKDPTCILKLSPAGEKLARINVRQIPEQCIGNKLYVRRIDDRTDFWVIGYIYV